MPRMLVLGNGWLGNICAKYFADEYVVTHFTQYLDSVDRHHVFHEHILNSDIILNLAGKTNIDWCEQNKERCFDANVTLPAYLAHEAKIHAKYLVHFSSACVFSSITRDDIKKEDSPTNPKCFYTETKVMAEKLVMEISPYSLIPRIRLPISEVPHPRNTIDKLLTYENINDTPESLTVIEDMLPVLADLIKVRETGLMHLINGGTVSPADIRKQFDDNFHIWTKEEQNENMKAMGRANRVTGYIASKRIKPLPPIHLRLPEVVAAYKAYRPYKP